MSQCVNTELGEMLHAYETGVLSEHDSEAFEVHLIECRYCRNEVLRFETASTMIRHDPTFRDIADSIESSKPEPKSFFKSILSFLWPNTPLIFKPAIGFLLILLLAYPAYLGVMVQTGSISVESIGPGERVMTLSAYRSISVPSFAADESVRIDLSASYQYIEYDGRPLIIRIVSVETEKEVFRSDDWQLSQELRIPANSLDPGKYSLELEDPKGEIEFNPREFRVK